MIVLKSQVFTFAEKHALKKVILFQCTIVDIIIGNVFNNTDSDDSAKPYVEHYNDHSDYRDANIFTMLFSGWELYRANKFEMFDIIIN